ncbi:hypothetical protein ACN47E_009274 [Coniothyrium glycines]
MAKKKKGAPTGSAANGASPPRAPSSAPSSAPPSQPAREATPAALIICRNKHWRYISSFHGPWLQLPPEVLDALAHSNFLAPRPRPIDPAVFYDLANIRRAVDEATTLAVRAASGLAAAALSTTLHHGPNLLGHPAALGIAHGGGGGSSRLSRERKHRMRELATTKLSHAYRLDEIAASVAAMQSASTLEDVAHLVLQRNPADLDAKYVHFFHEKIPSRMMAQCTPLDALDDIIAERPHDASPLRTRALTRIFKEDFVNSAKDLSEALNTARFLAAQHRAGKDQLVLAKSYQEQYGRDWRQEVKVAEEDQPSSLETQLLFHRAGVYFTMACGHVHAALDGLRGAEEAKARRDAEAAEGHDPTPETPEDAQGHQRRAEARKLVRQNAKRAIRDYTSFLSHFDYTPGIPPELAEEFLRRFDPSSGSLSTGSTNSRPTKSEKVSPNMSRLLDSSSTASPPVSEALVHHCRQPSQTPDWPKLPPLTIYPLSQLFDPVPPPSLPPYPNPSPSPATAFAASHETITYHPLLTDALHSLLLCHALVQTPPKEHLRHAHNAARLARVCDGYPIFLAARSPARADWIEVLRRAHNWIGLQSSWESLCRPAPLPGQGSGNNTKKGGEDSKKETDKERRERQKHEAILEALADERVVDEESFQRAVRARERRFKEDEETEKRASHTAASSSASTSTSTSTSSSSTSASSASTNAQSPAPPPPQPKRWAQDQGREYPISTERAEAVSRWVREAPRIVESSSSSTAKKRRAKGKARTVGLAKHNSTGLSSLAESVETLDVAHEEIDE